MIFVPQSIEWYKIMRMILFIKFSMFIILIKTYCETESIPTICLKPKEGKDLEIVAKIGRWRMNKAS